MDRLKRHTSVIGLGYVEVPVAVGFGRAGYQVLGFDIDSRRIAELSRATTAPARSSRPCSRRLVCATPRILRILPPPISTS